VERADPLGGGSLLLRSVFDPLQQDHRACFGADRGGPVAFVVFGFLVVTRGCLGEAHADSQLVAVQFVDAERVALPWAVDVDAFWRLGLAEAEGHRKTTGRTGRLAAFAFLAIAYCRGFLSSGSAFSFALDDQPDGFVLDNPFHVRWPRRRPAGALLGNQPPGALNHFCVGARPTRFGLVG